MGLSGEVWPLSTRGDEASKRLLKPGGRIVFSFLEYPLNVFIERGGSAPGQRTSLAVIDMRYGDDAFVPLSRPVTLDDGRVLSERGNLGQSICVLGVSFRLESDSFRPKANPSA